MPYDSAHQWAAQRPTTSNAVYGWYAKDYTPLPEDNPNCKYKIVQKPKPDLTYVAVKVAKREKTVLPPVSKSMPGLLRSQTWAPGTWSRNGPTGAHVPFERQHEKRMQNCIQKQKLLTLKDLEKASGKTQLLDPLQDQEVRLVSPNFPPPPKFVPQYKTLRHNYLWHVNAGYLVHVKP